MSGTERNAFTRVELLVVVALAGVLAALVPPAVERARAASGLTSCADNLRQIGLAAGKYAAANDRVLPNNRLSAPYGS